MATVEIVGVHPVPAADPCHLVELIVRGSDGPFDLSLFTQPVEGRPPSDWQAPYAEKILDPDGEAVIVDLWEGTGDEGHWTGEVRLAFFFHYLDPHRPFQTPFGEAKLPAPTNRPQRLRALDYEEP